MNDARLLPLGLAAALAAVSLTFTGCPDGAGGEDGGTDGGADAGIDPPILSPNDTGWWRDDVLYEVFVRSFQDSDADGKGDLVGLTQRLDYLNDGDATTTTDLGVDGVWLMPIFESPSYHGYDVVDYRAVDSEYGTEAEFDAFVAAAHARGMKVILDLVVNHTSSSHPWFLDAQSGPEAEHRDFYIWRSSPPPAGENWGRPWDGQATWHAANGAWYYGVYHGGMPDLNWRNPEVEAEFVAIMKHWLARGVDGFRVDAVRYLVESSPEELAANGGDSVQADHPFTHEVIQRLRYAIHQEYPETLFVAEAWTSANGVGPYYGEGNEFQLAFAFELSDGIRASVNAGTRSAVSQANYITGSVNVDRGFEAPFLSNHDQPRVMRTFGGSQPSWSEARIAAALLMAHPGTPFLYYGEEVGMVGGSQSGSRDEDKRTPMPWDHTEAKAGFTDAAETWFEAVSSTTGVEPADVDVAAQQADDQSLWNLYRRLIALRRASPALTSGVTERPTVTGGTNGVFALLRTPSAGSRMLFVVNLGATPSGAFTLATTGTVTPVLTEGSFTGPTQDGSALSFPDLPPYAFGFFQLD